MSHQQLEEVCFLFARNTLPYLQCKTNSKGGSEKKLSPVMASLLLFHMFWGHQGVTNLWEVSERDSKAQERMVKASDCDKAWFQAFLVSFQLCDSGKVIWLEPPSFELQDKSMSWSYRCSYIQSQCLASFSCLCGAHYDNCRIFIVYCLFGEDDGEGRALKEAEPD